MRLDQAIIATDQAPYYVEAACLAAAGWRRLGVDCVVGFVGEAIPPDVRSALPGGTLRVDHVPTSRSDWRGVACRLPLGIDPGRHAPLAAGEPRPVTMRAW